MEKWPEGSMTHVVKNMWTLSTHLVTCCIILAFASLFSRENELLYDAIKVRRLAELGRDLIRQLEGSSSIARRGGVLLDLLLQLNDSSDDTKHVRLDLGDIVRRVSRADNGRDEGRLPEAEQFVLQQLGTDIWEGVFGSADFDIMDIFNDIGPPE